jgi:hypothetical protein
MYPETWRVQKTTWDIHDQGQSGPDGRLSSSSNSYFEADFQECSHGFRLERDSRQAVNEINLQLRCKNAEFLLIQQLWHAGTEDTLFISRVPLFV